MSIVDPCAICPARPTITFGGLPMTQVGTSENIEITSTTGQKYSFPLESIGSIKNGTPDDPHDCTIGILSIQVTKAELDHVLYKAIDAVMKKRGITP